MKIIITGGTGLIGTALAADLVRDGHEVITLSRDPAHSSELLPAGIRLEKWDGRTAQGWGRLVDGADAIVNLAGENIGAGRWTADRKQRIVSSRAQAGAAVVEAIAQARYKPKLVIQSSGVDYYGVHGAETLTEDQQAGSGFLSETCLVWENSTLPVEKYRVRRVVYRGAVVLAMQGGALPRILMPFRYFVGGPLGGGQQWFSWIHLRDQIAGMRFFIENPNASGVYNLTAPNPIQNRSLARAIGKVMRRPDFFPVPAFLIRLLFGEMAVTVLGGQRVMPTRLEKEGFRFSFPHIELAFARSGLSYSLITGINGQLGDMVDST